MKIIPPLDTLETQKEIRVLDHQKEVKSLSWSSKKTLQYLRPQKIADRSQKTRSPRLSLLKMVMIGFLLVGILTGLIFISGETKTLLNHRITSNLSQNSTQSDDSLNLRDYFKKVTSFSSQSSSQSPTFTTSSQEIKTQIEKFLGQDRTNFAVYFKDLKTGQELDVDGNKSMPPASTSKVPYAILTLKEIQEGKRSLEDSLLLQDEHKFISEDAMFNYESGINYPLGEYLRNLIANSDNTAMMHLESLHGGNKTYNQKIAQLGIKLTRSPHITTAIDVGVVFEGIYRQKWLNQTNTDYLLDLMMTQTSLNNDRLVLAMKKFPEAKVAHKIGQLDTDNGVSYLDAGIIYGPKTDFVIVILNQDTTYIKGTTKIHEISQYLYKQLNT